MSRLAIIQNADEPQLLSSAMMLRAAGYDRIKYCGPALREELVRAGCDTVLSVELMVALGYDRLDDSIGAAGPADMERCDLFCEIKVRNVPKIVSRWPRLKGRMAYWRVNGAQPEVCPRGGDEVHLPCPIITACLWYGLPRYRCDVPADYDAPFSPTPHVSGQRKITEEEQRRWAGEAKLGANGMAYTMWPPYPRMGEYLRTDRSSLVSYERPYCLAHSAPAWGYRQIIDDCVAMGVRVYGNNAPAGQVSHRQVAAIAARAKALVHLKSVDCPGWALYEALLSGCPVVTGRLLNSRMLAYGLLAHGETCYEFGVPAQEEYGRGDMAFDKCLADIKEALERLSVPEENRRIGENGRKRLLEMLWTDEKDGDGWRAWMAEWFP